MPEVVGKAKRLQPLIPEYKDASDNMSRIKVEEYLDLSATFNIFAMSIELPPPKASIEAILLK